MSLEVYDPRRAPRGVRLPSNRSLRSLKMISDDPRADPHFDFFAIHEETREQFTGENAIDLVERNYPLGTQFLMYGNAKERKIFGVDLQALRATNTRFVTMNYFPNPLRDFEYSYGIQRNFSEVRFFPRTGNAFQRVRTLADFEAGLADPTKITTTTSLEGIYNYDGDHRNLPERLYADGIRTLMLVHNLDNELGTGQQTKTRNGITSLGEEVAYEAMLRGIGMDLSHASSWMSHGVLNVVERMMARGENPPPPDISHTGAKGLVARTNRNATDAVLLRVAELGGIVGIVDIKRCVAKDMRREATAEDYVRSLEYVVNLFEKNNIPDATKRVAVSTDSNGKMDGSQMSGKLDNYESFHLGLDTEFNRRGYSPEFQREIRYENVVDHTRRVLQAAA